MTERSYSNLKDKVNTFRIIDIIAAGAEVLSCSTLKRAVISLPSLAIEVLQSTAMHHTHILHMLSTYLMNLFLETQHHSHLNGSIQTCGPLEGPLSSLLVTAVDVPVLGGAYEDAYAVVPDNPESKAMVYGILAAILRSI